MGLGAGLGAPGSGFPGGESEESHILQPSQYFWEEEEELNDSSLDLGPTAGSCLLERLCKPPVGQVAMPLLGALSALPLSPSPSAPCWLCHSHPVLGILQCLTGPGRHLLL